MQQQRDVSVWSAILFPSMAAAMGWGIRGQYGHESGAMIAGALASLTIILLFASHFSSLAGARAAAIMTVAIGIGGSMTYGQTVGLTHDQALVGNWEAWRWGMLGLAIKGGLWIGFGGAFLGVGLGGRKYHPIEMIAVFCGLFGLYAAGVWMLNEPYDPATKQLPRFYFSDSWYFEPDADLKPRPEVWGGYLFAWLGLTGYLAFAKRDALAWRLAFWGLLGGALGFPAGQCFQSYHAWNAEAMASGPWADVYKNFNWWNIMETTFGAVWGAVLGFGVWRHRRLIPSQSLPDAVAIHPPLDVALIVVHVMLLLVSESHAVAGEIVARYTQWGLVMAALPIVGCVGGRFWPYMTLLPITAGPIILKSLREFYYKEAKLTLTESWIWAAIVPTAVLFFLVTHFLQRDGMQTTVRRFAAIALLANGWLYFALNTVFFDFAWPWEKWTVRTPNQLCFAGCLAGLTVLSCVALSRRQDSAAGTSS